MGERVHGLRGVYLLARFDGALFGMVRTVSYAESVKPQSPGSETARAFTLRALYNRRWQ